MTEFQKGIIVGVIIGIALYTCYRLARRRSSSLRVLPFPSPSTLTV